MSAGLRCPAPPLLPALLLTLLAGCESTPPEPRLTAASDRSPQTQAALAAASEAFQRGDLFRTEEALRQAMASAPDDPDIALDLGDTLARMGRNEAAREHYLGFLERHPGASQVRQAYGLVLITLGAWKESEREFVRLAKERPEDPTALFSLGLVLNRLGRYEEAIPSLRKAATLAPAGAGIQTELGIAALRMGRLPEASAALQKAVEIDPQNVAALHNLGNCYARMNRPQEAGAVLEQFARASKRQETFLDEKRLFKSAQSRAQELLQAGKAEKALEALLAYRSQLQDYAPFQQELGITYLQLGKPREASAAFQRALDLDPSLLVARARLTQLSARSAVSP
jgi:tetratricopeptide (TPR) repeat protein